MRKPAGRRGTAPDDRRLAFRLMLFTQPAAAARRARPAAVPRHPANGKQITDVVLHRFSGLASDLQQSAMISSVEYPKAREHPSGARFQAAADSANIPASSCGAEFSSVARTLRKER